MPPFKTRKSTDTYSTPAAITSCPTATYMQCRASDNEFSIPISRHDRVSTATFAWVLHVLQVLLVSLQQWQLHVQQRSVLLFRRIAASTIAFISYLGSFAAQLRSSSSSSSNSSNSGNSSSTQILNGLNKHSWIFLLIYLNLSAKGECHLNYLECCMQHQQYQQHRQQATVAAHGALFAALWQWQQQQHNARRQHIVTLTHKTTHEWDASILWAGVVVVLPLVDVIVVCQL